MVKLEARTDGAPPGKGLEVSAVWESQEQRDVTGGSRHPLEVSVVEPQDKDRSFTEITEAVNKQQSSAEVEFIWKDGLLYRSSLLQGSKAGKKYMLVLCYHIACYQVP